MTNPDNVGGLNDHAPVPLSEELRIEAALISGDVYVRGDAFVTRMTRMAEQAERLEELCRAAPAGGECQHEWQPDADVMNARYCPKCDVTQMLPRKSTKDSAPAGSGEVSSLIERLESTARAYPEDVFTPLTDEQKKTHGWVVQAASAGMGRHMAPLLLEAAALLRKLQQGAGR